MTHEVRLTPNGRAYMWSTGAEQGWRCSPYFRDVDDMAFRSELIEGRFAGQWTPDEVKYLVCSLISQGYLKLNKTPSWAREILPGAKPEDIQIGDEAYLYDENKVRRRMKIVNEVKKMSGARSLCGDFRGKLFWQDQLTVWKCKPSPYALGDLVGFKRFDYAAPHKITKIYDMLSVSDGTINFKSTGWHYIIEECKEYQAEDYFAGEDEIRPWEECKRG